MALRTACSGWPLCNGAPLPAADKHEVVHMVHRYLAAGLAIPLAWLVIQLWQDASRSVAWARVIAPLVVALYGAQVLVGALNVWYEFPDALAVGHTEIAATIWLTLSFLSHSRSSIRLCVPKCRANRR